MKYILFFLVVFTGFSQEKITDFGNDSTKSPKNLQYLGSVNNKILFTAFSPETGNEIWISDGTEKGTQLLRDINRGEFSVYPSSFVVDKSWAYFLVNGSIWKTDGTPESTFEIVQPATENRISFVSLTMLNNKVLAISSQYLLTYQTAFHWILPSNEIEKWEEKIVNYSIKNNSLFYTKITDSAPTYTVYHYLQTPKAIYTTKLGITSIWQFKNDTDIYCSLTTDYLEKTQRFLIKIDEKQIVQNMIFDWGNHQSSVPLSFKSDLGEFYLIKANSYKNGTDSLFLYKSQKDGLLATNRISGKNINASFSFTSGSNRFNSNVLFQAEKMFFVNGYFTYGTRVTYFNSIDFKTNTLKQTSGFYADSYGQMTVDKTNDSLYQAFSDYVLFTYDSKSNTIVERKYKKLGDKKFYVELNNQKFEISDNIYKLIGNDKIQLIEQRKIYSGNVSSILMNEQFNGKQYMLFSNIASNKSELWVLDTVKTKKIIDFKGLTYNSQFFRAKNLSDKLFFTILDSLQLSIYQTDGTVNGTILSYSFKIVPNSGYPIVRYTNDNQIVLQSVGKYIVISKFGISEITMNAGYPIYTSENTYFVKNDESINTLYKVVNGSLKYLLQSDSFYYAFFFESRFYFTNKKQLNYLDNDEKVTAIAQNIDYFTKSNNYLIFRKHLSSDTYSHNVIDLKTNKVVSEVKEKIGLSYNFEGDKGVYYIRQSSDSPAKVGVFDGKDSYQVFSAKSNIQNNPIFYKNGFFLQYSSLPNQDPDMLAYYDFSEKRFVNILTNSLPFSIKINQKSDFILIEQFLTSEERVYSVWSYKSRSLKSLTTEKGEIFNYDLPAGNYSKSSVNYNSFIWNFENDNLLRQEPERKNIDEIILEDIVTYETKFLIERGNELFAIGDGFSINFEEIVKGSEGISLGNTFIYNNQVYAYIFTYTHGWQVWKMGKSDKSPPLSTEEEIMTLNIFPNPATEIVNIQSISLCNYSVFNNRGQEVLKGKVDATQTINISSLPQGLYIFQFSDGVKVFSKKIVKF